MSYCCCRSRTWLRCGVVETASCSRRCVDVVDQDVEGIESCKSRMMCPRGISGEDRWQVDQEGGEVLVGWEGSTYMPGDSDGQQRDGGWGVWECGRVGVGMGNKGEGGVGGAGGGACQGCPSQETGRRGAD